MKFIFKKDAECQKRPGGIKLRYYFFNEYQLGHCEQPAGIKNELHSHKKIWETIMILEGELIARWEEKGKMRERKVVAGDVIEVGSFPHNFENQGNKTAEFIFIKQVLSGKSKKKILEKDKVFE